MWADKVGNGSVPDDIGRAKQAELAQHLIAARNALENCTVAGDDVLGTVREAITLIRRCDEAYRRADDELRRHWNQTVFERLEVDQGEVTIAQLTDGFAALIGTPHVPPEQGDGRSRTYCRRAQNPGVLFVGQGSSKGRLVGAEGLEPPTPSL